MSTVPVHTNLPIATYAKLHRAAAAHDTTVDALVAELVRRALVAAAEPQEAPAPRKRRAPSRVPREERLEQLAAVGTIRAAERVAERERKDQRIRELHARKLSDAQIATHFGITGQAIAQRRKILGLPANFAKAGRT